jgi:hypothetical protein
MNRQSPVESTFTPKSGSGKGTAMDETLRGHSGFLAAAEAAFEHLLWHHG